ncbi:hypothetical protein D3C83_270380 [compost metagenome]
MASVETAGLDWLETRDVTRSTLENLLVDQLIVLLEVAGRHDPAVATLVNKLVEQELNPS